VVDEVEMQHVSSQNFFNFPLIIIIPPLHFEVRNGVDKAVHYYIFGV
jgi:hypothetical protein